MCLTKDCPKLSHHDRWTCELCGWHHLPACQLAALAPRHQPAAQAAFSPTELELHFHCHSVTFDAYLLQFQKGDWMPHTHRGIQFNSTAGPREHRSRMCSRVSSLLGIHWWWGWGIWSNHCRGAYENRRCRCQARHADIHGGSSWGAIGNWRETAGNCRWTDERKGSQGCWWHHDTGDTQRR